MIRSMALALGVLLSTVAFADPIEGNWRTDSGETARISGGSTFTIVLQTGTHKGRRIGSLKADGGGKYSGEITDPANDKTYSGRGTLNGNNLQMKGCLKLLNWPCRTQNWQRM
ncbi:MAG: DUF2147 domain-containing protein [Rhizobiaceae bacterium]|nr:DUF2147 domain-containing protein [Rhizobiaceae bacterium]